MKNLLNNYSNYKAKYLINDLLSGLLVAIIALPLSIALGLQTVPNEVGGGIQMGIITAIVAGFIVAVLSGCKFQIGGPTAAFVVIIYGYLANPDIGVSGLIVATIFAGIILLILGLLKCGSLVKFIPYPIVVGFTTGIGITLLTGQIQNFCGFSGGGVEFLEKIIGYIESISSFNLATFLMGLGTLISIYLISKINKKLPSAFISIVIFTLLNIIIKGENLGVTTIGGKYGEITAYFKIADFSKLLNVNFVKIIVPTIVIAFLGALESLLSVAVADGMSKENSDYNQELIGQGVANVFSVILGGLPATGAIARTSANINSGAKSPLAGAFHAVFLLLMYFVLMSVVKFIPLCSLAAVLISVSINICNPKLFIKMSKFDLKDSLILFATMLLTVFFDLTYGVIGGFIVTIIVNVKCFKKSLKIEENEKAILVEGYLNFISVHKLISKLNKAFENESEVELNLKNLLNIDSSALEKLAKFNNSIKAKNKTLNVISYNENVAKKIVNYYEYLA